MVSVPLVPSVLPLVVSPVVSPKRVFRQPSVPEVTSTFVTSRVDIFREGRESEAGIASSSVSRGES